MKTETENTSKAKAAQLWLGFTDSQKTGVRIGMFPLRTMMDAKKEGYDEKGLCLELMACAKSNGGMIA